ncbi:MAG TPA: DUF2254 domain-containing protein, partial [Acidimicrobiales bacterium]|nr:DUF2254 domain-containing protein [Acidimicrobiales bacterium]
MTTVQARVPTRGGSRRAHLREWRRESLWLWPAVAAIGAWVAGDIATRHLRTFTFHEGLFPTNLDDARTLLATIAAALLTFTGVVFSITLVALQMSSTQYSPRVLRTFVRKPVTKLALATFIATFVYSLTLLAQVGTTTAAHTVPQGAVALAYLLVMASVLVFVVFVHSTVRSMRVSYVIQAVSKETMQAIHAMFAPASSYQEVAAPVLAAEPHVIPFDRADGVIDGVDTHHLAAVARHHGCVVRLCVPVGTYMVRGSHLLEVHGGTAPTAAQILGALDCGAVRSLYQDPCYGVRQLVDIAIRAVSPAINDPTTAVQTLDRLHGILRALADRPDPSGLALDAAGAVRVIIPEPDWTRVFDLAFTEIALYGAGDPQISRKLMAIFDDLSGCVEGERLATIESRRTWLRNEVAGRHSLNVDQVLAADPLGLG